MNRVVSGKRSNFLQKIYRARKKGQDKKIAELIKNYVADPRNAENTDFINHNNWDFVVEKEKKRKALINDIVFYSGLVIIVVVVVIGVLFFLFKLNKGGVGALLKGQQTDTPTVITEILEVKITSTATMEPTVTNTPTIIPSATEIVIEDSKYLVSDRLNISPELDDNEKGSTYWLFTNDAANVKPDVDKWIESADYAYSKYYSYKCINPIDEEENIEVVWQMDTRIPESAKYEIHISDPKYGSLGNFDYVILINGIEKEINTIRFEDGNSPDWRLLGVYDFNKGDMLQLKYLPESCDKSNEYITFCIDKILMIKR